MPKPTRREILEQAGLGATLVAGYTATARGYAKNDTINIGVIGCGGRAGRSLMPKAMALPGANVVAVCDIYDGNRARALKTASAGKKDGDVFACKYHEQLLERKDIDAVIVGTPDHWHVPVTIAACEAGKHVYCEKPLTHTISESESVVAAQNKHKRTVQIGTQQRSMPQVIKARELIRKGVLGDIHKVHMTWNRNHTPFRKRAPNIKPSETDWKRFLGNAKDQPFDPYRMLGNWRWFWDFGGGILTDLMVHWMDTALYCLDLETLPTKATTIGSSYSAGDVWETPDTIQTLLDYADRKIQIHFEGTFVNWHGRAGCTFMGTNGTLYVDRGRYELNPEPRRSFKSELFRPGKGEKGADFDIDGTSDHIANWLAAIRKGERANTPAEAGVLSAGAAHMGNQAFREMKVIERKA